MGADLVVSRRALALCYRAVVPHLDIATVPLLLLVLASVASSGCGDGASTGTGGSGGTGTSTGTGASTGAGTCALTENTTPTSAVSASGCAVESRDTSACAASRMAAGLSGYWLRFSCRVTLTKTQMGGVDYVEAHADGEPDHTSNYFAAGDPCHVDYAGGTQNPNTIAKTSYDVLFPLSPSGAGATMPGGVVGLALNGVGIFSNAAAPGDDIYKEVATFDACAGHPQMNGVYHYHTEPYSISNDDAAFIGVLRDGYPVYGRRDTDGSTPTLDASGGHVGVTADSPTTPVYHYHLNLQTSTNPQSAGQQAWFLTSGTFKAAPAACPACN